MRTSRNQIHLAPAPKPATSPRVDGPPTGSRPRRAALALSGGRVIVGALLAGVCWFGGVVAGAPANPARPGEPAGLAPSLVWPPPPAAPRLAYVGSIHRPSDAGVKRGAWGRFAHWLTGGDRGDEPLVHPFGLALDEHDNLCLTDTGANAICYFNRAKKKWQRWDRVGALRFASPVAVACRKGTFYVADSALGAVIGFDARGKLRFTLTNQLARPTGLTIAGERLFVTDAQRHCVVEFDLAGRYRSEFGRRGSGPGEFNFPTHIAADADGDLFVTDSMNNRIQRFDRRGRFKNQIGSGGNRPGFFGRPKGVAIDSLGHVYAMDALFDTLLIFDREGRFLLNVGEPGSRPGQFWLPAGIAISRRNEIFIADSYNQRIQMLNYIGQP